MGTEVLESWPTLFWITDHRSDYCAQSKSIAGDCCWCHHFLLKRNMGRAFPFVEPALSLFQRPFFTMNKHRQFSPVPKQDCDTCYQPAMSGFKAPALSVLVTWSQSRKKQSHFTPAGSRLESRLPSPELSFSRVTLIPKHTTALTSLTAYSWHFVFFWFLPSAYVSTAVYLS